MMLELPEPPSANKWWRNVDGRMVTSRAARQYKADVAARVRVDCIPKPVEVRITIDWYRGRRAGDLDKRLGILLDALQGILYQTDAQIVDIHARRFDDAARPRVVVGVSAV